MKSQKKLLAILMALILALSLITLPTFAQDGNTPEASSSVGELTATQETPIAGEPTATPEAPAGDVALMAVEPTATPKIIEDKSFEESWFKGSAEARITDKSTGKIRRKTLFSYNLGVTIDKPTISALDGTDLVEYVKKVAEKELQDLITYGTYAGATVVGDWEEDLRLPVFKKTQSYDDLRYEYGFDETAHRR